MLQEDLWALTELGLANTRFNVISIKHAQGQSLCYGPPLASYTENRIPWGLQLPLGKPNLHLTTIC